MSDKHNLMWLSEPEELDYPAALSYLSLIFDDHIALAYIDQLKRTTVTQFQAKDIFRASRLSLLGISNTHVDKDKQKILSGVALSPILLVRDTVHAKVVVADGYHRLCAVYYYDEDAVVPCKIV